MAFYLWRFSVDSLQADAELLYPLYLPVIWSSDQVLLLHVRRLSKP